MVPASFVLLPNLPRLPNGKVDRHALPAPDAQRPEMESPYVEPETETELAVASVWKELLRVEKVSRHDNFFDLGGHSLLATQTVNKLRNVCGVDLPLRAFFEDPTVAGLARKIDTFRQQAQNDLDNLTRLFEQVKQMSDEEVTRRLAQNA